MLLNDAGDELLALLGEDRAAARFNRHELPIPALVTCRVGCGFGRYGNSNRNVNKVIEIK